MTPYDPEKYTKRTTPCGNKNGYVENYLKKEFEKGKMTPAEFKKWKGRNESGKWKSMFNK